jgi:hypothetical protein
MITSRSRFDVSRFAAWDLTDRGPQQDENLYDTFLEMRDLLEAYAPAWYFDDLRKRVEALVQPKKK